MNRGKKKVLFSFLVLFLVTKHVFVFFRYLKSVKSRFVTKKSVFKKRRKKFLEN